jgi:hypothetical protein
VFLVVDCASDLAIETLRTRSGREPVAPRQHDPWLPPDPDYSKRVLTRAVVFVLAFLSFACLLGHFYGVWTMRFFGCWVAAGDSAAGVCCVAESRPGN